MCSDMGRDFYCAYRGVWVAESEFNGDKPNYYHEPEKGPAYVAASLGGCKCLKCSEKSNEKCAICDNPNRLRQEQFEKTQRNVSRYGNVFGRISDIITRCEQCALQYKLRGKLR